MTGPAVSAEMADYFQTLKSGALDAAEIAKKARLKGFDPVDQMEIPFADDLAGRVENLVGPEGISKRIREIAHTMDRERLCIFIAQEVARDMLKNGAPKERALDQATRTGLAILTEGVLVAPLEGIAEVRIGENFDGTDYADIYFAGPIRAAGGTAQALSVLIADQVRRSLNISSFKVIDQEVARYLEEFQLYKNMQYRPSNWEIEQVVRCCPVCINGEGTEEEEVQGNRGLKRVATEQVRSGVCLVIAEGVLLKAKKIIKITKALDIKGWEFLEDLPLKDKKEEAEKQAVDRSDKALEGLMPDEVTEEGAFLAEEALDEVEEHLDFDFGKESGEGRITLTDEGMEAKVEATSKYIKDLIAGRPVLCHPSRPGGFRLRYGRARTCGLASIGLNPYTLFLTGEFIAIGTQIKIERPGKAGAVTPVDSIDGPIVLLTNGDLVMVRDGKTCESVKDRIRSITDLGEVLIPFGEFAENNHPLVQGSFTEDWWKWEVQLALYQREHRTTEDPYTGAYTLEGDMQEIRKEEMAPHAALQKLERLPQMEEISRVQKECEAAADRKTKELLRTRARKAKTVDRELSAYDPAPFIPRDGKQAVMVSSELNVPLHPRYTLFWHDLTMNDLSRLRTHVMSSGSYSAEKGLMIQKDLSIKDILIALGCLHRETSEGYIVEDLAYPLITCLGLTEMLESSPLPEGFKDARNVMQAVNLLSRIRIMERSPTRVGARMGRPEKADIRQMKPPVHGLYPVGIDGGSQRLLKKTFGSPVETNTIPHECASCGSRTPYPRCPNCGERTHAMPGFEQRKGMMLNTKEDAERALRVLGIRSLAELPEMKGVKGLISKEKVPERVEKGLLRAANDVFVFRDGTIRYDMTDITLTHFKPSEIGTPVGKLRSLGYVRDIEGHELTSEDQVVELKVQDIIVNENAGDYLVKVAKFVDDELSSIYGMDHYYNASSRADLVGALAIGLAPHTSAGVLCRIIGYTKAFGCFGHPFYHASKRRNCDGDEDAILLLMDGLLNFSRKFLPEKRGGQMDAPLVLSMRLDPTEVDKEAHNVDVTDRYPLDFYRATMLKAKPNDYWMQRLDTIKTRLGTPLQYEGFRFSQDTIDINHAPRISSYKTIGLTEEKIKKQLELAKTIRAVDADDVAERVLSTHLLPDLIGNLRSYSQQSFRCTKCGTKYRRLTLSGRCNSFITTPKPHRCGNRLVLTVSEGSVKKYLGIAKTISEEYRVSNYLKQRIGLMWDSIESMFPTRFQETTLDRFM